MKPAVLAVTVPQGMSLYPAYRALAATYAVLELHVTSACNNHCTFCGDGWTNRDGNPAHVPRELLRQQLAEAHARGARRVILKGGEPTTRMDLDEIARDATALGYALVEVFTNARAAASDTGYQRLIATGARAWHVSVQAGTEALHDDAVQAPGAFRQTVEGLERLIASGAMVLVNAVLTWHLLQDLEAFASLMLRLKPAHVSLDTLKPGIVGGWGTSHQDASPLVHLRRPGERVDYTALQPRMSLYADRLAATARSLHEAGIDTRLTGFPPCLVPGAAYLADGFTPPGSLMTTLVLDGVKENEAEYSAMRTRAPGCTACAYSPTCGGVYTRYAQAWGLDELSPLPARVTDPRAAVEDTPPRSPLENALYATLVSGPHPLAGALQVARDGTCRFTCLPPNQDLVVTVAQGEGPAYRRTARFRVGYAGTTASPAHLRIVDAFARRLAALEPRLAPTVERLRDVPG